MPSPQRREVPGVRSLATETLTPRTRTPTEVSQQQRENGSSRLVDYAPARNGLPLTRYTWRAPRHPWHARAIAQAEAEHGPPEPTCVCGAPLTLVSGYGHCKICGYSTASSGKL